MHLTKTLRIPPTHDSTISSPTPQHYHRPSPTTPTTTSTSSSFSGSGPATATATATTLFNPLNQVKFYHIFFESRCSLSPSSVLVLMAVISLDLFLGFMLIEFISFLRDLYPIIPIPIPIPPHMLPPPAFKR
ncbi:unnamed protein product [Lactuca saligna]|uniref:Uncharacterized protein n=1 Tax=Lactuca saligna TaxID=75948 RepID=A0AA35Z7Q9_LACSI|nr:unnamed protein product [Lactuca saligna]